MFEPTSRLAAKLISAGAMRNEEYLEVLHLDPPFIIAIYVRIIAFRRAMRKIRERRITFVVLRVGCCRRSQLKQSFVVRVWR
jgi:hypothetical protein